MTKDSVDIEEFIERMEEQEQILLGMGRHQTFGELLRDSFAIFWKWLKYGCEP